MSKAKKTTTATETALATIDQIETVAPIQQMPLINPLVIDDNGVLQSSSLIKNGIVYPAPAAVINPIIAMFGNASEIRATGENEIEIVSADVKYTAFQRFNVIAKFQVDEEFFYEVGVLFALDLQVPKVKVYSGPVVRACLNLSVFGSDTLAKFDLTSNSMLDTVAVCVQTIAHRMTEARNTILKLKSVSLTPEITEKFIGAMSFNCVSSRSQFGNNYFNEGVKLLANDKSKYYYKQENFNAWLFYNAFTENIKKSSIFDMADKSKDFYSMVLNATNFLN